MPSSAKAAVGAASNRSPRLMAESSAFFIIFISLPSRWPKSCGMDRLGRNQRERLAPVPAIEPKVGVQCEDWGVRPKLGHAHEAGFRKGHRNIGVADHQVMHHGVMIANAEWQLQPALSEP